MSSDRHEAKPREIKHLVLGHTATERQSWDLSSSVAWLHTQAAGDGTAVTPLARENCRPLFPGSCGDSAHSSQFPLSAGHTLSAGGFQGEAAGTVTPSPATCVWSQWSNVASSEGSKSLKKRLFMILKPEEQKLPYRSFPR